MEVGSGMTDIDPKSDMELSTADGQVMVRVPLAGQVSSEWLRWYQRLARATGVPAQAQAHPDRAWIVVNVPADGNRGLVSTTTRLTVRTRVPKSRSASLDGGVVDEDVAGG
jgi:hypothetical protein